MPENRPQLRNPGVSVLSSHRIQAKRGWHATIGAEQARHR